MAVIGLAAADGFAFTSGAATERLVRSLFALPLWETTVYLDDDRLSRVTSGRMRRPRRIAVVVTRSSTSKQMKRPKTDRLPHVVGARGFVYWHVTATTSIPPAIRRPVSVLTYVCTYAQCILYTHIHIRTHARAARKKTSQTRH